MKTPLRISVDIDGVISDFGSNAIEVANLLWPGKIPPGYQPPDWDWTDMLTKQDWKELWTAIKATPHFWIRQGELAENVAALAEYLATAGTPVFFITSRAETTGMNAQDQSSIWLNNRGLKNYWQREPRVYVVPTPEDKIKLMKEHNIGLSIDDKAETVELCNTLNGHRAYLLDSPWNQYSKEPRVKNMSEFLREVQIFA